MAAIAGDLSKQIKGHSEGAQGFRPWWDVVEDNVLYAFVVLGMITLPMTFFSKTPIECTPHPKMWGNATEIKSISRLYPKTYCTEMLIDPFLLYLPFTLLMVPILLTAIEKTFVVLYQVEDKMNQFYLLLVKESLNSEDVANLAKENVRDCHEIEQAFKFSNACYASYLYRTLLEIIISALLALLFSFYNGSPGIGVPFFDCMVYGALFECIVPNSQFFLYIYVSSFVLIGAYFLCSVYNFLWIIYPAVGRLSRFLAGCSRQTDSYTEKSLAKGSEAPEVRLNLYFKPGAHDFSLLLNLLAESKGLPEALRILALFEHQFAMLWEPCNINLIQKSECNKQNNISKEEESMSPLQAMMMKSRKLHSVTVAWDDAQIADYFHQCYKSRYTFEYTVEISPTTEAPIKSILYFGDSSWRSMCDSEQELLGSSFLSLASSKRDFNFFSSTTAASRKYSLSFDGLEAGVNYKFTMSTEINGRTIMQTIRNFECSDD